MALAYVPRRPYDNDKFFEPGKRRTMEKSASQAPRAAGNSPAGDSKIRKKATLSGSAVMSLSWSGHIYNAPSAGEGLCLIFTSCVNRSSVSKLKYYIIVCTRLLQ